MKARFVKGRKEGLDDFEPMNIEDYYNEQRAESANMRKSIAAFLGGGATIDLPLSVPPYYCDLLAWALDRQRHSGGWKVVQVFGLSGAKAQYSRVSTAPGTEEELFYGGVMLLQRGDTRLGVYLKLDSEEGGAAVVSAATGQQRRAEAFMRGLQARVREKKLYKGHSIEFGARLTFLEPSHKTWDDIALPDSVKQSIIAHTTRFLDWAAELEPYGVSPRRGLLLTGKPGTGKTLACKAIMNTSPGVTCLVAHTSALMIPSYVDFLYQVAADLSPTIVFLEDIDLIGQGRIRSHYGVADALSRLLFALDGVVDCRNVVTVATTNWLDILDEALKDRPSRFDRIITIDPPDAEQRRAYLEYLADRIPLPAEMIDRLVDSTAGLTPAQIQEVVHCAAIEAPVPPGSPGYWDIAFSAHAIEIALSQVKRGNGTVGFPIRRTADVGVR